MNAEKIEIEYNGNKINLLDVVCPMCGSKMELKNAEMPYYGDQFSVKATHAPVYFVKQKVYQKISMCCPAGCVEEMVFKSDGLVYVETLE